MAFGKFSHLRKATQSSLGEDIEDTEKPLIQVVDDDLRIREGLKLNLHKTYRIRLCASGEEGIQRVDENVAVMILDIKMPGKNGLQVYEVVKARFPDLPIIFYSAYQGELEGAELSRTYEPFNYVDKSADVQELLDTLKHAVTFSQTLRHPK
jgi:CheY-like chemotaxis protein